MNYYIILNIYIASKKIKNDSLSIDIYVMMSILDGASRNL